MLSPVPLVAASAVLFLGLAAAISHILDRNLPFESAAAFDFENSLVQIDARQEYGETRYVALGIVRGRLHVLCFTETPDGIRVISFRKSNDREVRNYAQVQATD